VSARRGRQPAGSCMRERSTVVAWVQELGRARRCVVSSPGPSPLKRNAPPKRGISVEMGCVSQTAQSFERFKDQRPSTLGHDGRWRWIFAKRSLADRILANRSSRRRRRLPARQIGSGGSAQHRKGCSRCGQNLQHDVAPLKVCTTTLIRAESARSNGKMLEQRQSHNEKGGFLMPRGSLS
jgi:hypothetical protein